MEFPYYFYGLGFPSSFETDNYSVEHKKKQGVLKDTAFNSQKKRLLKEEKNSLVL